MPVRIYALAKELNIDSKDLLDICSRLGIADKGSPLASLDEDELAKLKRHLEASQGGGAAAEASAASSGRPAAPVVRAPIAPQAPVPPKVVERPSRPPAIPPSRPAVGGRASRTTTPSPIAPPVSAQPPAETVPPPEPQPDLVVPEASEVPAVAASSVEQPSAAPPLSPSSSPQAPARDGLAGFVGSSGKVRVLDGPRTGDAGKGGAEARRKRREREPVINLARMPGSGMAPPPPPPKAVEPTAQAPVVRLTKDMIVGTKQGMAAPLNEFVEQENKKAEKRVAAKGGLTDFKAAAEKAAKAKTGKTAAEEDELRKKRGLSGLATARAERTKRRTRLRPGEEVGRDDDDRRRSRRGLVRRGVNTAAPRKDKVVLELPCSVRSFSEAAGVPAARVLRSLMTLGAPLNINAVLDPEMAMMVAADMGVDVEFKQPESLEESLLSQLEGFDDPAEDLVPRPPIVTFLGHVDHGKTSLLDFFVGTKIVSGEAGGITQHIRSYRIERDGRVVCFVDTPGHEAFTEMRARGANVTDIAVLVVAADDGIMPQTEEAISHAKAAEVPIVVAMNKIDLPGADPTRVLTQLTEHGLTPSEWGGDVEVVRTSAITGEGMDVLLDTLLTVAEFNEYEANPKRAALGVCLESEQAADRGVIAKLIVQTGTLRTGDVLVCGSTYGRVKALFDTRTNRPLTEAGPSVPVNVTGFEEAPEAGERFYVLDDIAQAREIAERRSQVSRREQLSGTSQKVSFESFQEMLQSGSLGRVEEKVTLNLIIRADTRGSIEAIEKELAKFDHPEIQVRILQRSVGGITVADVTLAHASQAVVVGFNVIPDEAARSLAEERNVEIRRYDIIYNLAEDIKAMIEGRLKPEQRVVELGRALVKLVFTVSKVGTVAGCYVAQGSIQRGCRIRVNREGRTIGDYALDTLRRVKEDVKEVPRGMECGIKLANFNDVKQDDILEAYRVEEVARTLESATN